MPDSATSAPTLDELIFAARHRAYGAFDLRRHYRPTLTRALGLGIGLFMAGVSAPTLYARFFPAERSTERMIQIQTELVKLAEPPTEPPVVLPPAEPAPTVSTIRNLPPVVLPEADVVEQNLPPTTEQLQNATSGPVTAEGTGEMAIIAPPETPAPTATEIALDITPKADEPFVHVEQQPEYPGGFDALRDYLTRQLRYPRAAQSAGMTGKVFVSFIVNTDGTLTDVAVLKGLGFGCDEEALRVIRAMPRWKPGRQSGRPVRVKFNLPIVFALE